VEVWPVSTSINDDESITSGSWREDDAVEVRYPLPDSDRHDRSSWPWLPGTILAVCGPDEWQVCVEVRELATLEDGRPPHCNTPDHKLYYPVCFRDSSEIRSNAVVGERAEISR
jgi:hypothetical protein